VVYFYLINISSQLGDSKVRNINEHKTKSEETNSAIGYC
jgi:hypothetical protein